MADLYYELNSVVFSQDCDIFDNIKPSGCLSYFQDIAGLHAEIIGVGYEPTKAKGYFWVILYEQFEVVSRLPVYSEEILVKTWPKPRGKVEFEREYEICDILGNPLVRGISNWVLIDINKRMISKATDVIFNGEYISYTNYEEKQKRKLGLKGETFDSEYKHIVRLSDLDHNMHLNNCKYLDIIYNMQDINNYKKWKKVEIAFIHEAKLGDELVVKHYVDEYNNHCYKGFVLDKDCFEAIIYLED